MKLKKNIFIYFSLIISIIYPCYSQNKIEENNTIGELIIENKEVSNLIEEIIIKHSKTKYKNLNELREKEELHTALWNFTFNNENFLVYKNLLINQSNFLTQKNFKSLNANKNILSVLHQNLYPWLYGYRYKSLSDIINSSYGKGIVICTPNKYFHFVRSTIDTFRYVLNTTLPIEIFYNGEDDLSLVNREILSQYDNVFISDITKYFNNRIVNISNFAIKPFSILASRFEEVLLMDADSFFIKDPVELFNDIGYREKGTLFFRDRKLPYYENRINWLKSFIINPLPETRESNIWNKISAEELESSAVVIHKTKNILGLLNACKLNEKKLRDKIIYRNVYGDKETFWIGFEMSRQNYNVSPIPCAAIGRVEIEKDENNKIIKKICGNISNIAHTLRNKELIFWNGHIVVDKEININKIGKFEAYYIEDNDSYYDDYCLVLKNGQEPIYFNDKEIEILNKILEREKRNRYITNE